MKIYFSRIVSVIALLIFINCSDKKEPLYKYQKPVDEKMDSTTSFLKDETNFLESNYEALFDSYYDKKIKEKDYKSAVKVLKIVATNAMRFQSYSSTFKDKLVFFSANYARYITDKKMLSFLNLYLGKYYADNRDYEVAIKYYLLGTKHDVNDFETCYSKAVNFRNIAWCYFCLGEQDLAIQNNLKALELLKMTDRKDLLGGVYFNLYPIYSATKDYKNAEANLNKASYYFSLDKEKNLTNIYICLYNKIQLYDQTRRVEERRLLIDSTLLAFKNSKLDDPSMEISLYLSDFKMKLEDSKVKEAEEILNKIKPVITALNSDYSTNDYNLSLAMLEIRKTGIKDTRIITDAIPVLVGNGDFQNVLGAYSILYDDALKKKQYESALNFYLQLQEAADSLGSDKMRNKVVELETKYETKKKQQQIQLQEKTILNKNTTIALLVSLFIGLFLAIVVYVLNQKKKKLKLEKQNAQLYTKQLLDKTEEERKRIASDLHDSVSHELLSLKNSFETNTSLTNQKIDGIINEIRSISRNLHPIMFDKIGLTTSINQMVERAQEVNQFMVTAELDYDNSLTSAQELQLYRIIQEALSNIIKYANAVAAKITIIDKQSKLFIEIKDNGTGFNVNEKLNGTNAFGLHNIIERSRAIGGEAKIYSDKNGTVITIEIMK